MALSIGVTVGSRITVGGHALHVKAARPNEFVVTVDGGPEVVVGAETREEILPDVFVSALAGPASGRLAFETAGAIRIDRIEGPRV